jgi:hypothetical protein
VARQRVFGSKQAAHFQRDRAIARQRRRQKLQERRTTVGGMLEPAKRTEPKCVSSIAQPQKDYRPADRMPTSPLSQRRCRLVYEVGGKSHRSGSMQSLRPIIAREEQRLMHSPSKLVQLPIVISAVPNIPVRSTLWRLKRFSQLERHGYQMYLQKSRLRSPNGP